MTAEDIAIGNQDTVSASNC